MASTDFYLDPKTLSVFFVDAITKAGHGSIVGWRSSPMSRQPGASGSPQGVDVLTADGRVLRVGTVPGGVVEVIDITEQQTAASSS